jgi:SNF2 family DNA or RNA helicase
VYPPAYPADEIHEILGGRQTKDDKQAHRYRVAPTALNVLSLGEWYGESFITTAPKPVQDLFYSDWGFPGFEVHRDLMERAHSHPRWKDLYPFQQAAVEYVVCNPHRGAILALSPGLGKTVVSVVAWDILGATRVLVLAPLTLAKNWGKEISRWSRFYRSWVRTTAAEKDPQSEVTITNFETVFYTVLRREDGKTFAPDDFLSVLDPQGNEQSTYFVEHDDRREFSDGTSATEKPWGQARNPRAAKMWIEAGPKKKDPKTGKKVFVRERITMARPSYANQDWDLIIIDESILLKNRKAVKVDVIQQLAKFSHYVLLLSGSPTAKYRDDLWPQLKTIMPRGFSAYWRFADFFCIVDRGQWGWEILKDRPDHPPSTYLKDFLYVRNQKDVLPDLPDYIYDPIEIDLRPEQQKAFKQMLEEWIVALEAEEEGHVQPGDEDLEAVNRLAQMTRMSQITSNLCNLEKGAGKPMPNVSAQEDLLIDLMRNGDIELPLLVWSWFVPTTESIDARIEKEFKGSISTTYVTGSMTTDQKDAGIEAYKNGETDVLVLQMSVGKFGHNLVNTRSVYYHDRTWDSDAYLQSLFRVKRIGLTHVPRLIVPRAQVSADPLIEANLAGKMQSISKIAAHDLSGLLKSLGNMEWSMTDYGSGLDI